MDELQAARKAEQAAEKAEQEARRIASSRRAAEAEQAESQQRQIQEAARAAAVAASEAERRELEGHLNGIKRMLLDHAARGVSDRATAIQTVSMRPRWFMEQFSISKRFWQRANRTCLTE